MFNQAFSYLMQQLTAIFAPEALAYGNTSSPQGEVDLVQFLENEVKVGDIIFSQTPSTIYGLFRNFFGQDYDHVAVVISKSEVIHISPPIVSRLHIKHILRADRFPLIIRPNSNVEQFVMVLNTFLGEKYDVSKFMSLFYNRLKIRFNFSLSDHDFSFHSLKYSRVCTDTVLYALWRADPGLFEEAKHDKDFCDSFRIYGNVMIDVLLSLLETRYKIIYRSEFTRPSPAKSRIVLEGPFRGLSLNFFVKFLNLLSRVQLPNQLRKFQQTKLGALRRKFKSVAKIINVYNHFTKLDPDLALLQNLRIALPVLQGVCGFLGVRSGALNVVKLLVDLSYYYALYSGIQSGVSGVWNQQRAKL